MMPVAAMRLHRRLRPVMAMAAMALAVVRLHAAHAVVRAMMMPLAAAVLRVLRERARRAAEEDRDAGHQGKDQVLHLPTSAFMIDTRDVVLHSFFLRMPLDESDPFPQPRRAGGPPV